MSANFFSLVLSFVLINVSFSWSSTINSILKPKTLLQINEGLSPIIIDSVAAGAEMAMEECKNVFKWDRWNCPQSAFSRQIKHLSTKEKAYTDAIIAAGIIYSITRDCSKGIIKGCGCDPNLRTSLQENSLLQSSLNQEKNNKAEKDWIWGGCSDDASFGENLVLKLLQESEKSTDPQGFVSRHNNRVGREIIREKMLKTCKCHGVSGSCSFQTCWMQMPTFRDIAKQLRERFDKAVMISFEKVEGALILGNTVRQRSLEADTELPNNLVYLEESSNFCQSNNATGWPGTKGRVCSKTANAASVAEKRSCKNLCRSCGYKVRKQKKRISHRCNCKFKWCCEVECDVCVQSVDEYHCV